MNTQTQRYTGSVRTDRVGEFVKGDLEAYITQKGITDQQIVSYSHESTAVVERYNPTLSAIVRPSLEYARRSLPAEAYNWASFIK